MWTAQTVDISFLLKYADQISHLITENGIVIVLLFLFMWMVYKNNGNVSRKLTELEKYERETMLDALTACTTGLSNSTNALKQSSMAIDKLSTRLKEYETIHKQVVKLLNAKEQCVCNPKED